MPHEQNLSPKEVAAIIGCHVATVKRACQDGLGFKFRGHWQIPRSQVDQIRNRGEEPVTAITEQRVALVRAAINGGGACSLNAVVAETGLRRTIVQDCLRRLGYSWSAGDGALRKEGA